MENIKLNKPLKIISTSIFLFNIISLYVHVEAERIKLHLLTTNKVFYVRVNSGASISALKRIGDTREVQFIFNGQILNENSSFDDYDIKCEDVIFVLDAPNLKDQKFQEQWLKISQNVEKFAEEIALIFSNPECRRENMRLKDSYMLRAEANPKRWRKLESNFLLHNEVKCSEDIVPTNPEYESKLSEDPLPTFW